VGSSLGRLDGVDWVWVFQCKILQISARLSLCVTVVDEMISVAGEENNTYDLRGGQLICSAGRVQWRVQWQPPVVAWEWSSAMLQPCSPAMDLFPPLFQSWPSTLYQQQWLKVWPNNWSFLHCIYLLGVKQVIHWWIPGPIAGTLEWWLAVCQCVGFLVNLINDYLQHKL